MRSKLFFILLLAFISSRVFAQDTIAVDSTIHYQTIIGWGHGGGAYGGVNGLYQMIDTAVANPVSYQMFDYLVDDLGLTGSRTWEVGPRIDGTGMDDGDCDSINWSKFESGSMSAQIAQNLVYYKNKIIANGYQPNFYSSPGYPTHATDQKPWIMYHPGERAQQIWASALYLKNTYGININYDVIYNEPSSPITSTILADDIKALGPRLVNKGLITRSQYPENVTPQSAWNNITPVQNDSILWTWVGRLSYHNYGTADPYRSYIYNFGLTKGLTTAQTEMDSPTFDDLYNDLTIANVSYWEVGFSSSNTLVPDTGLTHFTPSNTFFRLRQLMHYVRPGAIRIGTNSNDASLHILSFLQNGKVITAIENTSGTAKTVHLTGIPSGTYGRSQASSGASWFQELGVNTVGVGGTIDFNVNGGSTVTTLYPYTGPNHPPTIMTWKSSPGYLVLPASAATLKVTANDPELNALTYQWTVTSHPVGSNPVLGTPNALTTSVTGLTVAGNYIFNIDVHDGTNTSSKKVHLIVYTSNPPPVLGQTGFRISAPYGLVFGDPADTTHANIELPTSSVTLQAGIADIANDNFTGQGTWSLVQQPSGANITLSSTTYIYVSLRATVTGMTVPGDYIFQINVTNPGHPDLTACIICTVHPASSAPVITSITPSPAVLTLPASTTLLTAVTHDPEGDLMRYWWSVVSAPAGAYPTFDQQCKPVTNAGGLTVPGTYVFQLRAFDDLHMTTHNVTVQVNISTGIENKTDSKASILIYPNPFTDRITVVIPGNSVSHANLVITDIAGRVLIQKNDCASGSVLDLSALSRGTYILRIETTEDNGYMKLIKQ